MTTSLFWHEFRRSAVWSLFVPTAVLLGLLFWVATLPGPLPFAQGPDGLLQARAGAVAHDYAYVAEVLLATVAALPALVVTNDIGDGSRGLILTYPVWTLHLALIRLAVALAWCAMWACAVLALSDALGIGLPWARDLALLLPVEAFVLAGVFAVTEWTREPGLGTGFAALALVLGYGVPGLPFAHPVSMHLEVVDAHNHLLSQAVWANRLALLALALLLVAVGTTGLAFQRGRGGYAGS